MTILTPARLQTLSTSFPLLSTNWYYLAAATFSICNVPEEVPVIFEYMLQKVDTDKEKFEMVQRIREAILKSSALGGLPKAINSLMQLKTATPEPLRETRLQRTPAHQQGLEDRGATFFDQVYGKINKRVMSQMSTAYPDLGYYALNHVYAPLLSYTGILGPKETSLVVIASLIPQDVNPQLKGHLKGALNNGATKEEVMQVRELAMLIAKWSGVNWKSEVAKL
ncbi:uncharacterized protein SAPINGB_P000484 [Magnusiomyces paraingens]|uniref:Carboxymuconolactone decarboxylase-like domain-containing protein n=1 Tax=Magnusiomyces paraingens TaxID=2606893 RepID=A0A5E8AZR5_9ASCO|nr:uncharacterized protein SAPINGB_P000484 [Saprochaete ingens]VVT44642.1 unnamed protein product [Saprochaete ingens]